MDLFYLLYLSRPQFLRFSLDFHFLRIIYIFFNIQKVV